MYFYFGDLLKTFYVSQLATRLTGHQTDRHIGARLRGLARTHWA